MLGFIVGTICLIALIKVARRGRAFGGGCGGYSRRAGGRRGFWWWVYESLETTPGQERTMQLAVEEMKNASEGMRREMKQARQALADALAGESLDEAAVQKAYARLEVEAQQIKERFIESIKGVHETLTPAQRKRLSTMVSRGFAPFGA